MEIVVIGTTEFTPGFALAGVANTVIANKTNALQKIIEYQDAGIIVLDESLITDIEMAKREELETSIKPIIIMLAKDGAPSRARLKRAIMNTLGVDLLK